MKNLLNKIRWGIYNNLYVLLAKRGSSGILPNKDDDRDDPWYGNYYEYEQKYEEIDIASDYAVKDWRFDQAPFNICIFASAIMAASWQEGIRFSVRWAVKLAVRESKKGRKMVYGDGFSYLRAPKKLMKKYGMLPYEEMPDEIGNMSWSEYSKWTPEDEKLLAVAGNYRPEGRYRKIRTKYQAFAAVDQGYVISTACMWYRGMNYPQPEYFILYRTGRKIGGHAYADTGYKAQGLIITNSFGLDWGNNGQGIDSSLFEKGDFAGYIQEKLSIEQKIHYFVKYHEGKAIKGTKGTIYIVAHGGKKAFKTWNQYLKWCSQHAINSNSYTLVREEIINALPDYGQIK